MDTEKTFKTKTGYCHILPDKIVLTRNGIIGNIAQVTVGNSIVKPLISYGLISLGELYLIFISYKNDMYYVSGMLFLLWVLLIIQIIKSLNNSGTPIIKREKSLISHLKKPYQELHELTLLCVLRMIKEK